MDTALHHAGLSMKIAQLDALRCLCPLDCTCVLALHQLLAELATEPEPFDGNVHTVSVCGAKTELMSTANMIPAAGL